MNTYSKQFAAWVTGLQSETFQKARLKLTAFYILMLAIILCVFSFSLYFALAKNLRGDLDGEFGDENAQLRVIKQTTDHLQTTIFLIDGGVLVLASFLSFALAGKTLRPIEEALLAQKQFSADASHEFRTPLSIMKSDIEVAQNNKQLNLQEAKAVIDSNLEEVNHMSTMVDQLLKLSRHEDQLEKLSMTSVNFITVVKDAVKKMQKLAENKNINLTFIHEGYGSVLGNLSSLKEMTLNLLQNAIDYTPEHGSVAVAIKDLEKHLELSIKDTGIGIEPKDLPNIFKRFYKADNARTLRSNSSGLGLSIVHNIVQNHNGKINIESALGTGTVVKVLLPKLV